MFPHILVLFASLFIGISNVVQAGDLTKHSVFFESVPSGASVCKTVLKRVDCIGKTPLRTEVELYGRASSSRFTIKKIGYESKETIIDSGTSKIAVSLNKSDLFYNPNKHDDTKSRSIQKALNNRLSELIYSYKHSTHPNFKLIGNRKVIKSRQGIIVKFPILINDYAVLKKMKKSGRIRNYKKRYANTMKTLNEYGIFPFFDLVIREIRSLPIDEVVFDIVYPSSKTVLDFKQVQRVGQTYSHSDYSNKAGSRVRKDYYKSYTTTSNVTVTKDKNQLINYSFILTIGNFNKTANMYKDLDKIIIYTNDTHKNEYKKIDI